MKKIFLIMISLSFVLVASLSASEIDQIRQMQQLQDQAPSDTRLADYFDKLKAHPKDTQIHLELGKIYAERALYQLAIASYRRALEFQPDFAPAHSSLGSCATVTLRRQGPHRGR